MAHETAVAISVGKTLPHIPGSVMVTPGVLLQVSFHTLPGELRTKTRQVLLYVLSVVAAFLVGFVDSFRYIRI
jgi:uncharacterized membrane protein SirB2